MTRTSGPGRHPAVAPHQIWIVAADAGRARIFSAALVDGELTELEDMLAPAARLHAHERASDRKGHVAGGAGGHAFEPHESAAEHDAGDFARRLCQRLATARHEGQLSRLYLIAAPAFLGKLRAHLDRDTQALVREEIASDLCHKPARAIRAALPEHL